jgi:hypothetical protein
MLRIIFHRAGHMHMHLAMCGGGMVRTREAERRRWRRRCCPRPARLHDKRAEVVLGCRMVSNGVGHGSGPAKPYLPKCGSATKEMTTP